MVEHRVDADLGGFSGPVILGHGRQDAVAPLAYVRKLVETRPAVALRIIAGDHHIAIRDPSAIAAAVVDVTA